MDQKESMTVEFKSEAKNPISDHELLDEVVGMANALGGVIYLGKEDDGTPTGASKLHQDIDGLRAMVVNKTIPSVVVDPQWKMEEGKVVVAIQVPIASQVVATTQGKVVQRRMKANGTPEVVPFFPWEFSSRRSFLSEFDPSSMVISPLGLSDFDRPSLESLKEEMSRGSTSDKTLLGLNDEEFLLSLGLLQQDHEKTSMTLAGLLLLGKEKDLAKFAPGSMFVYQILRYGAVQKNEEIRENIVMAFKRFGAFVDSFNLEEEMLVNMRRVGVPTFDPEGLREAFANAVAHRDYARLGAVRVILDEAGLTIASPGSLIHGLQTSNLLAAEPRGRNPLLSLALKRTGYCEKTGRGVDKIFYGQARFGKAWPDYSGSDDGNVVVFFPKSEMDVLFARKMMELKEPLPLFSVLILSWIRRNGIGVKEELAAALGIGAERLEGYLIPLHARGLIEPLDLKGPWAIANSFLSEVGTKEVPLDKLLEKTAYIAKRNNGIITNSILQSELGLEPSKSYYLLKKLCDQGKLKRIQSGKYAKYEWIHD